jgi:hypothetical protein
MRHDLRSTVESTANPDVQAFAVRAAARKRREAIGFLSRRGKRKAGRSPGALTDAVGTRGVERRQHCGDGRTGEGRAALRRSEIAAEPLLQLPDRSAEARQVMFGQRRQRLDEHQPAKMCGLGVRHRCEAGKSRRLFGAMHPATRRVEDYQNPPIIRKRHVADDWRRRRCGAMPTVDNKAAAAKQSDANSRASAAPKLQRVGFNIQRPIVQTTQAGRYGKRELSPGTEADVCGNAMRDTYRMGLVKRERALHDRQILPHPIAFRAGDFGGFRSLNREAGFQITDSKSYAAEPPAESAIEIEKT